MADVNPPPIAIDPGPITINEPIEPIVITAPRLDFLSDFSPYEFRIESMGILNSAGRTTDVFNLVREVSIFQDIYSGVMSGYAILFDNIDIICEFNMCGNEFFAASFYHAQDPSVKMSKVFRIYKIADREQLGNTGQVYKIHFCSDFQVISDTTEINKAYVGKKNSEIVEDILKEYLKVPSNRYTVESTDDTFDHIITNLRPVQAINWLASKSYSKSKNSYCYFFYESINVNDEPILPKFHFKSLGAMYEKDAKYTLNLASSVLVGAEGGYQYTITKFEILDEFDILRSTMTGGFASKITGVDIFNQRATVYEKTLEDQKDSLLNKNLPINKLKERNDLSLLESHDALNLFYHEIKDNPTAKDNNIEFILNRAQSLSTLNNFRMKIVLQGNIFLNIGETVKIEFPKFNPVDASTKIKQYNEYRGSSEVDGRFLITSIRHLIKGDLFETVVELCSDSFAKELPAATDIVDDEF